jgi:hypothetical protein
MNEENEVTTPSYYGTKEYEEGKTAYPIDNCPYPITTTDSRRFRWYMGYYDARYACFAHIPETDILDVDIKNRLPQKVKK